MLKLKIVKSNQELVEAGSIISAQYNGFSLYPYADYYLADRFNAVRSVVRYLEKQDYDFALRQLEVVKEFLLTELIFKKIEEETEPNETCTPLTVLQEIEELSEDILRRKKWQTEKERREQRNNGSNLKEMLESSEQ